MIDLDASSQDDEWAVRSFANWIGCGLSEDQKRWKAYFSDFTDLPSADPFETARQQVFELQSAQWIEDAGFDRATFVSMIRADALLRSLTKVVESERLAPISPAVTNSPEGSIVLEWQNGAKSVTTYVADEGFEVLKAWGPDMDDEMVHVEEAVEADALEAYRWLLAL